MQNLVGAWWVTTSYARPKTTRHIYTTNHRGLYSVHPSKYNNGEALHTLYFNAGFFLGGGDAL